MSFLEVEDWSNKVFVMARDAKVKNDKWRANPTIEGFVDNAKVVENMLKIWKVANRSSWIKEMNMSDHTYQFSDFDKQK